MGRGEPCSLPLSCLKKYFLKPEHPQYRTFLSFPSPNPEILRIIKYKELRKQSSGPYTYRQESNKGHHKEPARGSAAPVPTASQSHLGHKTHICLPSRAAASLCLRLVPQRNPSSTHKPIFHEQKKALPSLSSSLPKYTKVQRSLSPLQESSESQTHPRSATAF